MRITIDRKKGFQLAVLLIVGIGIYWTILHESRLLTVVWLAVGGVYIALRSTDAAIWMLVFLVPFEMWLPNNFLYLLFFIAAILREKKLPKAAVLCSFLFMGLVFPWILTTDDAVSIMMKGQLIWVIVFYTVLRGYRGADPARICRSFCLSALIFSVDVLALSWKYAGLYMLESRLGGGALGEKLPAAVRIPSENMIGLLMALGIISTLLELHYTGKKRYFTLLWFLIVGFLTKSTTFLVLCVILHVFYYALISPKGKNRIRQMVVEGMVAAAGLIAVYAVYPGFYSRFVRRLTLPDITNGRADIFREYNLGFIKGSIWNILFGYGSQGMDALAGGHNLHNVTQAWYICYGVIGFLCIALMIVYLVWICYQSKASRKSYFISILPLLVFLAGGQTMSPSCIWLLPVLLMLRLSNLQGGTGPCTLRLQGEGLPIRARRQ